MLRLGRRARKTANLNAPNPTRRSPMSLDRLAFLQESAAAAAVLTLPELPRPDQSALAPNFAQIETLHAEAVARLQGWIHQPSIAAENRGMSEGCDLTMRLF